MIDDVRDIIERVRSLRDALPEIRRLVANDDWRKKEDAATALVEISKKKEDEVIKKMINWAENNDPNIRRTASEGLRGIARRSPEKVLPVIEKLKTDDSLYIRKSVAALSRAISKRNPEFVIDLCRKLARLKNKNTNWTTKQGIKKLPEEKQEELIYLLGE